MIKISVVIPAYNAARTLEPLLKSLFTQTFPCQNYEVILADDGSEDKTAQIAKRYPVVYLFQKNKGAGPARNLGAKKAKGEVILFVDSDTLVGKSFVKRHWQAHLKNKKIGAIGGGVKAPIKGSYLAWADHFSSWHNAHEKLKEHLEEEYLPCVNMSLKKNIFQEIHGFWEKKDTGEDVELCLRLRQRGYQILFDPGLGLWHTAPDFAGFLNHNYNWGKHGRAVRGSHPELRFHWLLSQKGLAAFLVFPLLVFGWPVFLFCEWLPFRPWRLLSCLPLIFIGRLAYGLGFLAANLRK